MDNLRVGVIAGVIVTHVSTAYVLDVDWYYEERSTNGVTQVAVGTVILPAALFALASLFLVAGMLSHRSLVRKGQRRFVRDRLLRLGGPLLAYALVIGPFTSLIGQRAQGSIFADDAGSFFLSEMRRADTGPMWFLAALLGFSIAYGAWRGARPGCSTPTGPLRRRHLAVAGAVIVVGSFAMRLAWPFAADTPLSLNLWEWPQMATLFVFGALAAERGWLDPIPQWIPRTCGRASAAGFAGLLVVVVSAGASGDGTPFLGGWHAQALAEPIVEATIAVTASLWLIGWFARHWNHHGPLGRSLARASFPAYVLHPTVVVSLSAALAAVAVVPEIKFVIVAVLGVAASFAVGWLFTRVRFPVHRATFGSGGVSMLRHS